MAGFDQFWKRHEQLTGLQFGFANAALGVFSSYNQLSKYVEGNYIYNNLEGFIQDNWRVNPKLTLDFGLRLVHQQPQYDSLGQGVNWLPDKWSLSSAPLYYLAGCATTYPCSGSNRQAKDPRTGQLLGPNTAVAIGTLVPGSGNFINGLFPSGTDPVPTTTYYWPMLSVAPRFGVAYDVTGKQTIVLRGGAGLYFDRPSGNTVYSQIANPPNELSQTLYYSSFQTMGGLTTQGAANLNVYQLDSGLPKTWTWNAGVQYMLPFNTMLDVSYVGEHAYNVVEQTNINPVDIGAAYLAANQDPTVTSSLPGGAAVTQNMMRSIRGYGSINMMIPRGFFTSHSLQIMVNRRFAHGVQFRVSDTIMLKRFGDAGARIQHDANGVWSYRPDQDQANELFTNYIPTRHTFKADFVWSIPALNVGSGFTQQLVKAVTRDWQLSGIWSANTASAYTVGASFQNGAGNQQITGSPDFGGRIKVIADPGGGCTGDIYRQFNISAFAPPAVGSVGLESGNDYMRGCFYQQWDLALQREFRLRRGPAAFVPDRRFQRVQPVPHYRAKHEHASGEPDRSDDRESSVRLQRQPDPHAIDTEDLGLRHGQRLSRGANHSAMAPIQVLKTICLRRHPLPAQAFPVSRGISRTYLRQRHVPEFETLRSAEKSFGLAALDEAFPLEGVATDCAEIDVEFSGVGTYALETTQIVFAANESQVRDHDSVVLGRRSASDCRHLRQTEMTRSHPTFPQ